MNRAERSDNASKAAAPGRARSEVRIEDHGDPGNRHTRSGKSGSANDSTRSPGEAPDNAGALALLAAWKKEDAEDGEDTTAELEELMRELDANRMSDRKLFP